MLLVHLSDFHLSRYGETGTWTERAANDKWELIHTWQRWQIEGLRDKKNRPEKLRLVDPSGVIHKQRSWPKNDDKAIGALLTLAMDRHLTSAESLVNDRPTPQDLRSLLRIDRKNTNLLFLRLVDEINCIGPDLLLLTGDITDNGFGYGLVEHYFSQWIAQGRLLVVPGNHDTYDMFPRKGRKARVAAKEKRYRQFAKKVGMKLHTSGAWVQHVEDIALVGLSSCKPPLTPLSASGEVTKAQLTWLTALAGKSALNDARLRLALVHHHMLRMPFELGKRSPIEVGLRLRNAPQVMDACKTAGVDMLFNGHRHHGYTVKLPGHPMVISAPSSTLGCKSTDLEYLWLVNLKQDRPFPHLHPMPAIHTPNNPRGRSPRRVG